MQPTDRLRKLNTTDCLWVYVLRILKDGPTHAYTIRATIEQRYGFRPGTMTAYKVLYLLEKDGFVKKTVQGRKRVYSLTEKGKGELQRARSFYKDLVKRLAS
ncbi:MAG: PadR family transcriptional regulator [Nanoarchaeota archaeon]|nr:PadR family transcriptional regulator [Nanoarchaeota archaeon]